MNHQKMIRHCGKKMSSYFTKRKLDKLIVQKLEFTEATTIRIFLTLRSVEEKSTDSTVRECKKK